MRLIAAFPVSCLCFAAAALARLAAMSFEEAGTALGDDVFKVREEAEQVIRSAGLDAYEPVAKLAASDNPEVAERARRSLPILLLAIDENFSPALADPLRRIDDFCGPDLEQILVGLTGLKPPRLVTLVGLHSHWQARRPDSPTASQKLNATLEHALLATLRGDTVLTDLGGLHPERYETATLAMVLNNLCKVRPDDIPALLPLHLCWSRCHPRLPQLLNGDGFQLEVAREAKLAPDRIAALDKILNFASTRELSAEQLAAVQHSIQAALRGDTVLTDLSQLNPESYETATLAMILDSLCKQRPDDLSPLLPLHDAWSRSRPQLLQRLNADGYRLEVAKETCDTADRSEALRKILSLATKRALTNDQKAALRKQLANYRDDAAGFPVASLDQDTGWYFFDVFGSDQGGQAHLESYRAFRARFPEIAAKALLAQPLEVLLVLDKSGPGEALTYAMKQSGHGGVMLLGEWLHTHPELIREPLPLPDIKDQAYPYRTIKFFRIFAPYADDAALQSHPEIAAAVALLAKDPRWLDVAKQARALIARENKDARQPAP